MAPKNATWTATFSGKWCPKTYFNVCGFEENGTIIFAVHDGGFTKMVGIKKTANGQSRIDGRYTPKNVLIKLKKDAIFAAWQTTANTGVGHDQYQLSDIKNY